jgi:hypothetical protein
VICKRSAVGCCLNESLCGRVLESPPIHTNGIDSEISRKSSSCTRLSWHISHSRMFSNCPKKGLTTLPLSLALVLESPDSRREQVSFSRSLSIVVTVGGMDKVEEHGGGEPGEGGRAVE